MFNRTLIATHEGHHEGITVKDSHDWDQIVIAVLDEPELSINEVGCDQEVLTIHAYII